MKCPHIIGRHLAALLAFALQGAGLAAHAAAATTTPSPPDLGGGLLRSVLSLVIVLVLIVGCAWLARRFGARLNGEPSRLLKTVGALSVGQRERIVVVELGEQWLVLGVAPGRVSTLAQMPRRPLAEPVRPTGAAAFAQLLSRARHETP